MKIPKKTDLTPAKLFWDSFTSDCGSEVPDEWKLELYSYLILGLPSGSFHSAVFSNNLMGAAITSHPMNTWSAIMAMCRWLAQQAPTESWGSYEKYNNWISMSNKDRNEILVNARLLYSTEDLTWKILSVT